MWFWDAGLLRCSFLWHFLESWDGVYVCVCARGWIDFRVMVDGNLGSYVGWLVHMVVRVGLCGILALLHLEGRMHVPDCVALWGCLNAKIEELAQLVSAVGSLPPI